MTVAESVRVVRNDGEHRYEARLDDAVIAAAHFRARPGRVIFTHIQTEPEYEGQGVASLLARHALDDVRARGDTVVAQCPFIAGYIRRHPEYADLLASNRG